MLWKFNKWFSHILIDRNKLVIAFTPQNILDLELNTNVSLTEKNKILDAVSFSFFNDVLVQECSICIHEFVSALKFCSLWFTSFFYREYHSSIRNWRKHLEYHSSMYKAITESNPYIILAFYFICFIWLSVMYY